MYLLAIHIFVYVKCLLKFWPYFIWVVFLLNCKTYFYIFGVLVICQIYSYITFFFQSEACLLIFLIVSFEEKFLILMMSMLSVLLFMLFVS